MTRIYKDKAGNTLHRDPYTGSMEARNAKGKLVNKKGFEILAKRAGIQGHFTKSKNTRRFTF
jgi:hypothetical protein